MDKEMVSCFFCGNYFYRNLGHLNENLKLGRNNYCSLKCLGLHRKNHKTLICENPNCYRIFERTYKGVSPHNYCSRTCAITINNSKFPKHPGIRKNCFICGKTFVSLEKYCSRSCKDKGMIITNENIIKMIKQFYVQEGRIPTKSEFHNYSASRNRFETWNNAIRAAGFKPNPVMFAKKYFANDGHKCDSLSEKIIDDWLYARNIVHQRNYPYPGGRGLTVDFLVKNYWIEFFGLSGQLKRYDQLKRIKFSLVKKYKLNLIDIYPDQFIPINKLKTLLGRLVF